MRARLLVPAWVLALAALTAGGLAGCSGSKSASDLGDPATVLAKAGRELATTSGVHLGLATDDLPDGVQGVKGASGVVTDAPAFDGTLTVTISAGSFPVPVRSVDGTVYAQIPLTPGWSQVKPDDYGAPDPALLIDRTQGLPAVLSATTAPKAGDQSRGGADNKEVLTTYTGTVPGSAVAHLIPGAASGGDFKASYEIDSDGALRRAALTGVFYGGKPSMTYTLTVDDYGTTQDITAP